MRSGFWPNDSHTDSTGQTKVMENMSTNTPARAPRRRVRHDIADSIAVMGFSLGASVAVAALIAFATRVAW